LGIAGSGLVTLVRGNCREWELPGVGIAELWFVGRILVSRGLVLVCRVDVGRVSPRQLPDKLNGARPRETKTRPDNQTAPTQLPNIPRESPDKLRWWHTYHQKCSRPQVDLWTALFHRGPRPSEEGLLGQPRVPIRPAQQPDGALEELVNPANLIPMSNMSCGVHALTSI